MNDVLIRAKLIFHGEDGEDREDAVHSAEEQKSANQYQKQPIVYNVSKALPKIFDNKRKAQLANAGFSVWRAGLFREIPRPAVVRKLRS